MSEGSNRMIAACIRTSYWPVNKIIPTGLLLMEKKPEKCQFFLWTRISFSHTKKIIVYPPQDGITETYVQESTIESRFFSGA